MQFTHPGILYLVFGLLLPLLVAVLLWARWQRKRDMNAFGAGSLVAQLTGHISPGRRKWRLGLLLAAVLFLGMALSGPQYGAKMVEVRRQGRDVLIALDVSESMLAEDVRPNRLQRAQQELAFLIDQLHGDRVGVMAFAGSAQVACPLTTDYEAAKMFLNYLSPESVAVQGTSLGTAIRIGTDVFSQGSEGYRVLVLLTDGEDHDSQPLEAAQAAKAAGIKILSIGFGTAQGEPIPIRDASGANSGYLKDASGKTVVSQLDEKLLRQITEVTGGIYVPAYQGSLEAKEIADAIEKMQTRDISGGQYGAMEDRYQFFLLPALLLLLAAFWLPERKKSWLFVLLCACLLPGALWAGVAEEVNRGNRHYLHGQYQDALDDYREAQIQEPKNPVVSYNLGNAMHQLQNTKDAEEAYQKALTAKQPALRARTLYNLGNNYFDQEKYQEAIQHYREALKLKPRDEDTIYNLAQAMYLLKNPQARKEHEKQKQDQQKQQQKQDQQKTGGQGQEQKPQAAEQKKGQGKGEQGKPGQPKGTDDRGEAKAGQEQKQDTPAAAAARKYKPGEMRPEEAENILNAVREAEKDAQRERMKKMQQQQPHQKNETYW